MSAWRIRRFAGRQGKVDSPLPPPCRGLILPRNQPPSLKQSNSTVKLSMMEMRDLLEVSAALTRVANDADQEVSRLKGQVFWGLDVDRSDDRLAPADFLLGLPDDPLNVVLGLSDAEGFGPPGLVFG